MPTRIPMSEIRRYRRRTRLGRDHSRRASEADARIPRWSLRPPVTAEGMTLTQVQDIAREVGAGSDLLVARAAGRRPSWAVGGDYGGPGIRATVLLGNPISVGHVWNSRPRLSDDEWDQLVVRFREILHCPGGR